MSTPTETSTLLPTVTASATIPPTATPPDRTCPAEQPVKPDYARYVLGETVWPTPDPAGFTPHFWLDTPIELDDEEPELRINPGYPYGSDGSERYLLHNGVDISGALGTPLLAATDGLVAVAQDDYTELYGWRCDWYGHLVAIEVDMRYRGLPVYILYGHVLNLSVEAGDLIPSGRQVAEVGVGGASTAAHLHLEVRVGGNEFGMTRNPLLWLKPAEDRGLIAGRLVDPEGRPWQGVQIVAAGPTYAATWSYLDDPTHFIRPDDELAENFVLGNLQPGNYRVMATVQGTEYSVNVTVVAGQASQVEIVTEAYKTPTPAPPATATPEPTPASDETDTPSP
jgi:murein DD-endopeptidase MepM/ murein hydrolase activator NlpD